MTLQEMKNQIAIHKKTLADISVLNLRVQTGDTASHLEPKQTESMSLALDLIRSFLRLEIETLEIRMEDLK